GGRVCHGGSAPPRRCFLPPPVSGDGTARPIAIVLEIRREARTVSTASRLRDIQGPFRSEREIARIVEFGHHHLARGRRRDLAGVWLREAGLGQGSQHLRGE